MQVQLTKINTIVFLSGEKGRERFDAIEVPPTVGDWKPMARPNYYDQQAGFTHFRYLKKVVALGGLPISFEVREAK
jgi:hypothetical protein